MIAIILTVIIGGQPAQRFISAGRFDTVQSCKATIAAEARGREALRAMIEARAGVAAQIIPSCVILSGGVAL